MLSRQFLRQGAPSRLAVSACQQRLQPKGRRRMAVKAWQDVEHGNQGAHREPDPVLKSALDTILHRYWGTAPTAASVIDKLYTRGFGANEVYHDHLAFRTLGVPGMGIESLGRVLGEFGFTKQDYYAFPRKQLLATWYAPPAGLYERLPRIFVSELQVQKLSPNAQRILAKYSAHLGSAFSPSHAWTGALTGALPWGPPTYEDYQALQEESEYAAWVLVNGYALNHTALSTHRITTHEGDIYDYADQLKAAGFAMNDEGGVMKISPDGGLLQCSTVADMFDFRFADGQVRPAVGAYLEFVERKPLAQHQHLPAAQLTEAHRRDGFEAASADKIFMSTALAAAQQQQQQQRRAVAQ